MKNEKLESLARGLSAWKKYRKAMLEMQKQQMDSSSTTNKPSGVQSVDSDGGIRDQQMRYLQLLCSRSTK